MVSHKGKLTLENQSQKCENVPNTYGALYVGKDVGNDTVVHLGAAAWGNDMSGP